MQAVIYGPVTLPACRLDCAHAAGQDICKDKRHGSYALELAAGCFTFHGGSFEHPTWKGTGFESLGRKDVVVPLPQLQLFQDATEQYGNGVFPNENLLPKRLPRGI